MMKSHLAVFFVTCFFCCAFVTSDSVYALSFPVPRDQVEILLAFKNEFPSNNCDLNWNPAFSDHDYPKANISSWTKDANYFDGVFFDSKTGVVTELRLHRQCLTSLKDNSSLFRFQHLRYLDLSENHFDTSPIPARLDRLTNLEFLDLSMNGFVGQVPSSISNLSRLTVLNLSYNKLTGGIPIIQNLTLLTGLDLSYNKLTGRIPNLQNLTLLTRIDFSYNHFSESIPSYLFTMPSLQYLDLRQNHLRDPLENMTSSATSKLEYLYMANNLLSHRILEPISNLSALLHLDLSFQNTTHTFNFDFLRIKSLMYLDLSGNRVSVLGTPGSATLSYLIVSSCNITEFPTFIKGLKKLWWLDISTNRLKGKVPEWLWNLPSMHRLNLSHNSFSILEGSPKVFLNSSIWELDLSSNAFQGSFPLTPPDIEVMAASNNNFTGGIPLTFCKASRLRLLDLSNNNFIGSIPRCLGNVSIEALKLHNNNLSGRIPDMTTTKRTLSGLVLLDVGHNQISGKLPRSLVNCTSLQFLNVENNRITDTFPFWLKALSDLEVIVLRSNRFHGPISSPGNTLPFPALRIIDISHNNFSGSLPLNYFANWSAPLVNSPQVFNWPDYTGDQHMDPIEFTPLWLYPSIYLRIKGRNMEFEKIQDIYRAIDFSGNRFGGQIPESIGHLKSLMALDLSNNSFTGHVPSSLAKLKQLESLDLSQNQLSGRIPQELSVLTFLEYINMSHNRLTGQIPQSTQIGGQAKSCFEGNLNLCGLPLQESCFRVNGAPSTHEPELPKKEQMVNWKAAAIGYGPGVLIGLAIGQALASYKPVLFYKLFRL